MGARDLAMLLAFIAYAGIATAAQITIGTDVLSVTVTIDPVGTCVASLMFNLTLAQGGSPAWTPNLLATSAQCSNPSTGTALAVQAQAYQLQFPVGGTIQAQTATSVTVSGITLGNVASETWSLSINGSALSWAIQRTYTADGRAESDQFPGVWLQTTTIPYKPGPGKREDTDGPGGAASSTSSDWQSQVQIPYFTALDTDLLNPATGVGYSVGAGARTAILGDSTVGDTRRVMLSPAGVAMHVSSSTCRFAMYRPSSVFTQTLGIGSECAAGPGNAYSFATGDVKSTAFTLDFKATTQGIAWFDLSLPEGSPAAPLAAQAGIMASIFPLSMGWINGNSPQCETCVHEASVFPQVQGMYRLTPPPLESGGGTASCPGYANPFCAYSESINTVSASLECAPGGTIVSIDAAYGTPTVMQGQDSCSGFVRNASCDDTSFPAYATATCVGSTSCTLERHLGDPDPCPNIEKWIVATARCSGTGPGGRQVPPPGACPTWQAATGLHMSFLLSQSVNQSSGQVSPRWDVVTGNDWAFEGIIDQMPHMVLAAYYHALNTNDTATVAGWMPTLDLIADYMMGAMIVNQSGILTNTNPACDGVANHSCADNFWDDVRFGWHDAIVGAYAVDSFRALGDLKTWLGDPAGATPYYATHTRMIQAYNDEFWDEGLGGYHDWVDSNGNKRSYFYTWQNYAAIEFGIASPAQAATILTTNDRLYAHVVQAYNVTPQALWCTPTNLIPLDPSDLTTDFDNEYNFGNYENGACFQWHAGLQSLAKGRVRGAEAAYDSLAAAMAVFNTTRLWGQRWSWLDGTPMGSDVISDGLFLLYGGLFGALNIRTSLLGGVQVLGPAAPALEGANFTIGLRGVDVTINVANGYARVL